MLMPKRQSDSFSKSLKWVQLVFYIGLILYFGKVLFVPLLFGLLVALIIFPVCKKMENKGLARTLSITIVLTFVIILFVALVWLLGIEINIFLKDFPLISGRLSALTPGLEKWIEHSFNISPPDQSIWLQKLTTNFDKDITTFLKGAFNTTIATLIMLVMIPVYAALFLYHRETFVRFIALLLGPEHRGQLQMVLHESVVSYFKFIKGNFYVYCIVGILNSVGLFALGIKHAILYGMLTSFMMVIPYVGIFISAAIPVSIALVTKDSIWYPLGVILIFVFIQYLESNVIFPKVVGTQLNLSTWATLVAIVAGTLLWGIAGMVLASPFLAILKIITDHVPAWKPLNVLLNRAEGYQGKGKASSAAISP
jgi:predicted PurR-regulated permease PerM